MRFFLFKLNPSEAVSSGGEIEVQLLDSKGRAKETVYTQPGADTIRIGDKDYSGILLLKAKSLKQGQGVYVNEHGIEVQPF